MKRLIVALMITAFACAGVEAKENCPCKPRKKVAHKVTKRRAIARAPLPTPCKLIPNEVCTISADRRSVQCYKTTDGVNETPMNSAITEYGSTGITPKKKMDFNMETIVIKGPTRDYCKRDDNAKVTTCYHSGFKLVRDENGLYSYAKVAPSDVNNSTRVDMPRLPGQY
jgi:hypothetical protein